MTGKNTFDTPGGHPSPGWSVIPSVSIPPSTWTTIEDALGAALTDVQKERIQLGIQHQRHAIREAMVTAQDVTQTLAGLAALGPALGMRAYAKADRWAQAEIASAMKRAGIVDGARWASPSAAEIARFANEALAHGIEERNGKRDPSRDLARLIWKWWADFGGTPYSATTAEGDTSTPIVRFAVRIFGAAGVPVTPSGATKRLQRVKQKA